MIPATRRLRIIVARVATITPVPTGPSHGASIRCVHRESARPNRNIGSAMNRVLAIVRDLAVLSCSRSYRTILGADAAKAIAASDITTVGQLGIDRKAMPLSTKAPPNTGAINCQFGSIRSRSTQLSDPRRAGGRFGAAVRGFSVCPAGVPCGWAAGTVVPSRGMRAESWSCSGLAGLADIDLPMRRNHLRNG